VSPKAPNPRLAALIARFRAGSIERVRKIAAALDDVEHGADASAAAGVAPELHTLKGEAQVLGFEEISEVAHACETAIAGGLNRETAARVRRALEVVAASLREELGDATAAKAALRRAGEAATSEPAPTAAQEAAPVAASQPAPVTSSQPAPMATSPPASGPASSRERFLQVNAARVEELCDAVGALSSELRAHAAEARVRPHGATRAERLRNDALERCVELLSAVDDAAWALRMIPVGPLFDTLAEHARKIAADANKRARVVTRGGDVSLERDVVDALWKPMLHVVRNAIDHGLEPLAERGTKPPTGLLEISAEQAGASVVVTIADDGRGICLEDVRRTAVARELVSASRAAAMNVDELFALLFFRGFSTRSEVTALSGRGIGLDVVRDALEAVGGEASISSAEGKGTRVTLRMPAKVSREHLVMFEVGGTVVAFAAREVHAVVDRVRESDAGGTIEHEGHSLKLRSLSECLSMDGDEIEPWAVVISAAGSAAYAVPKIVGEASYVLVPADKVLAASGMVRASTVTDDGRPVAVLNAAALVRLAETAPAARASTRAVEKRAPIEVLVVDDSAITRDLVAGVVSSAGFSVRTAPDGAAGLAAIRARTPHAVVCDVEMPIMTGLELLGEARAFSPTLPIILLTSRSSDVARKEALALGATAFVAKSEFGENLLLDLIRRHAEVQA
jgi:chemotaxis protein histidine kinase CheA/ActR/RegA family two-component response regulator